MDTIEMTQLRERLVAAEMRCASLKRRLDATETRLSEATAAVVAERRFKQDQYDWLVDVANDLKDLARSVTHPTFGASRSLQEFLLKRLNDPVFELVPARGEG